MKIKVRNISYQKAMSFLKKNPGKSIKPMKPMFLLRLIMRIASQFDLWRTHFTCTGSVPKDTPCLILMNHSSFIDLEIAQTLVFPKPMGIVATSDGFVGKPWLMRLLGCIPTKKFVTDLSLLPNMKYLLKEKKCSVLLFPEASYTFDGTATPLPRRLGLLLKKLDVPVVYIQTYGAFAHNPLYNCLRRRKVDVSAQVTTLLTPEQIREKSVDDLDQILDRAFSFDQFLWQRENKVRTTEPFLGEGLERILYRCPHCGTEGKMVGKDRTLTCHACQKKWNMDDFGSLTAEDGETEYSHIPDWYAMQREQVRREIADGTYGFCADVEIAVMVDYRAIYRVGRGTLCHNTQGFTLNGCNGQLQYSQLPKASYGLYADYYWYELGDVICIGNSQILYYCFPPKGFPVAKARLAAEELYRMVRAAKRPRKKENTEID